jgi:hypothetical protein
MGHGSKSSGKYPDPIDPLTHEPDSFETPDYVENTFKIIVLFLYNLCYDKIVSPLLMGGANICKGGSIHDREFKGQGFNW